MGNVVQLTRTPHPRPVRIARHAAVRPQTARQWAVRKAVTAARLLSPSAATSVALVARSTSLCSIRTGELRPRSGELYLAVGLADLLAVLTAKQVVGSSTRFPRCGRSSIRSRVFP